MDNINMNKFNGHEAYIISKALDLYVNAMAEEIESIEQYLNPEEEKAEHNKQTEQVRKPRTWGKEWTCEYCGMHMKLEPEFEDSRFMCNKNYKDHKI